MCICLSPASAIRILALVRAASLLTALMLIASPTARADDPRWSVRGTLNLALPVSSDQVGRLAYDRPGFLGSVDAGRALGQAFELRAGVLGGPFLSSNDAAGGLLAAYAGVRASVPARRVRPYLALDLGGALTGVLVRPYLALGAGVDIALSERLALGPTFGYGRVIQWNGAAYSTDAGYLAIGISLQVKLGRQPAPKPAPQVRAPKPPPTRIRMRPAPEPPPTPPASDEILTLIERVLPAPSQRVELLAPVLFAFDSDTLEPLGVAMLHEVARMLRVRADIELVAIEGYADERGGADYNRALSQRRAERVRAWLIEHEIAPERLTIAPEGATSFVEPGKDESAHEQNRRVVFRVLKTKEP